MTHHLLHLVPLEKNVKSCLWANGMIQIFIFFFFTSTFNGHEMFLLTISLSRTDDARLTQTKAESGAHFETLAETLCSMPNTFV